MNHKYQELFDSATIRPEWQHQVDTIVAKIEEHRSEYQNVAYLVNINMPWYFVGVVHNMEASLDFTKHLHNGDSLLHRTVHVPAGRPVQNPENGFAHGYTWQESAVDALKLKGFDKYHDWDIPSMLYRLEAYNGFGYSKYHGINTPYLWSGTNQYTKGKYAADGKYDPELVSKQVGGAAILKLLIQKENT